MWIACSFLEIHAYKPLELGLRFVVKVYLSVVLADLKEYNLVKVFELSAMFFVDNCIR